MLIIFGLVPIPIDLSGMVRRARSLNSHQQALRVTGIHKNTPVKIRLIQSKNVSFFLFLRLFHDFTRVNRGVLLSRLLHACEPGVLLLRLLHACEPGVLLLRLLHACEPGLMHCTYTCSTQFSRSNAARVLIVFF